MTDELPLLKGDGHGNYRIVIWGNSGAGKSTLSGQLDSLLSIKPIYLDNLLWNDDWVETPRPKLANLISAETATNSSWITDGNYFSVSHSFLPQATDIIWLDYPLYITFFRCLKRTWSRFWSGETLFGTNCRERWQEVLFSRDSILWWCISQDGPVRRRLEETLRTSERDLPLRKRFTRPSEVDQWVSEVEKIKKKV